MYASDFQRAGHRENQTARSERRVHNFLKLDLIEITAHYHRSSPGGSEQHRKITDVSHRARNERGLRIDEPDRPILGTYFKRGTVHCWDARRARTHEDRIK